MAETYAIFYTDCMNDCLLPTERHVSVWKKVGTDPDASDLQSVLRNVCVLEDELNKRTGESECW